MIFFGEKFLEYDAMAEYPRRGTGRGTGRGGWTKFWEASTR